MPVIYQSNKAKTRVTITLIEFCKTISPTASRLSGYNMKAKNLDEMLKRNDYVKLVPALHERAHKIVKMVKEKMESLEINSIEIKVNDKSYFICNDYAVDESYAPCRYLMIYRDKQYYLLEEDVDIQYDSVHAQQNKNLLFFLNHAKDVIRAIDEKEDELVQNIENALKNADTL